MKFLGTLNLTRRKSKPVEVELRQREPQREPENPQPETLLAQGADDGTMVDEKAGGDQAAVDSQKSVVPMVGPLALEVQGREQEEAQVEGTVLTAASVLKDLRAAYTFLGVSKNGSKPTVRSRLKKEVATAKFKASAQASEEVQKQ